MNSAPTRPSLGRRVLGMFFTWLFLGALIGVIGGLGQGGGIQIVCMMIGGMAVLPIAGVLLGLIGGDRWAPGLRDSRMLRCGANSTTSHECDRDLRSLGRGDRFPVREVLALEIRDDVPHDLLGDRRHASVGQGLGTRRSRPHTEPPDRLLGPFGTETRTIATTSAAQSADELNRSYWSRWRKWRRGAETAGLPLEERPCRSP